MRGESFFALSGPRLLLLEDAHVRFGTAFIVVVVQLLSLLLLLLFSNKAARFVEPSPALFSRCQLFRQRRFFPFNPATMWSVEDVDSLSRMLLLSFQ